MLNMVANITTYNLPLQCSSRNINFHDCYQCCHNNTKHVNYTSELVSLSWKDMCFKKVYFCKVVGWNDFLNTREALCNPHLISCSVHFKKSLTSATRNSVHKFEHSTGLSSTFYNLSYSCLLRAQIQKKNTHRKGSYFFFPVRNKYIKSVKVHKANCPAATVTYIFSSTVFVFWALVFSWTTPSGGPWAPGNILKFVLWETACCKTPSTWQCESN